MTLARNPQRAEDHDSAPGPPAVTHTRRDIVRKGAKLAFIAPVISTFFAKDAYAASNYCSPNGNPCATDAQCCSGNCDTFGSNTCVP